MATGAKKTKCESEGKGAVGYEGSKRQGINSATQLAKETFWEGIRQDLSCGKNISKTQSLDGNVGSWTESDGISSSDVGRLALYVMEQDQSGDKDSLFFMDWELARVAFSRHITLDMLCQEMHEAWSQGCCCQEALVTARKPFSHRGRAVTVEERDVVGGKRSEEESVTGLMTERACWYPSFSKFCRGVNTLCPFLE